MELDEGESTLSTGRADQRDADGVRNIEKVDEDLLSFFQIRGVLDQLAGEGVDAGVVHGPWIAVRNRSSKRKAETLDMRYSAFPHPGQRGFGAGHR